ncbi:GNAT family N-acetyltransferase [Lacticaseibacillus casei]|uniref:GNAT family N-acetyltransferase n=1 Tax=Lacticaseibacillus casei TaxID=1582 RepID=UPI001C384F22|nr:GNAT family N-acetyltransferase [Lacticaseibacillus casei]QXG59282.1 GNAT family N-acetyltransferase [Lacticaseibacillus casei]
MLREAQFVDLSAIVDLYQQLTTEMATLAPDTYRPLATDNRQYFADYLQNDLARLFVTESHGKLTGFALLVLAQTSASPEFVPQHFAQLIDLFVIPDQRHHGLAKQLMAAVAAFAKSHQASFIQLNVLSANKTAREVYAKAGFEPVNLTLQKPLN